MDKTDKPKTTIVYQEGAVVSKEILHKPGGTVTLFAFDKGQGLSEHTTPFDAVVLVTDGIADVTVIKATTRVHAGEFIVMPANSPHALKAVERFTMMLIMIKS